MENDYKAKQQNIHIIILAAFAIFAAIFIFTVGSKPKPTPIAHASFNGYTYYRSITVTSTASVASGTLTSFPMFFSSGSSSYSWLAASSSGGTLQNPNGYDFIFATSTACATGVNFQVENYTSSTGAINAWVQVPTISTGTVLYICYDNSSITTSQQHTSSTWDSNYVGVWHFPKSSGTLVASDSTSFANNLTASGTSATTGALGGNTDGGAAFTPNDYLRETTFSNSTTTMTVEAWVYSANFAQNAMIFNVETTNKHWHFSFETNHLSLYGASTTPTVSSTLPSNSAWHLLVGVLNGATGTIYMDGALQTSGSITKASTTSGALDVGGYTDSGGGYYFTGDMDELRISKTVRTSQWILTEYNSENSPQTFYTVGSQIGGTGGTDTWISASASNWNTAANWSLGVVPGSSSTALFSASSTANCTINAAVNVAGINMTSGYTGGTITQSSGKTITVGSSGWTQSGGIFTGDSAGDAISINGPFSLTGGTFTSTSGDLWLAASSTISGATFNNNSGTVAFISTSTTATITGSSTFNALLLSDGYLSSVSSASTTLTIPTGTVLTVNGSTTFDTDSNFVYLLGGGQIDAMGDVLLGGWQTAPSVIPTSTFNLVLDGAGMQNVNDNSYNQMQYFYDAGDPFGFILPSLTINKTSGSVKFNNSYLYLTGNFTNTNATAINPGSSTFIFGDASGTITGSSTFYNLAFTQPQPVTTTVVIATGTTLIVQNQFFVATNDNTPLQFLGGGQIDVQGNIEEGIQYPSASTGTASIVLDGTGTQMIGDQTACSVFTVGAPTGGDTYYCDTLSLPNLTVAKPSGVAYIEDVFPVALPLSIQITGSTTISQGELQLSTGTNPIDVQFDGPLTINNGAVLSDYPAASSSVEFGSSVTNNGLLFFDGSTEACTAPLPNDVMLDSTTTGKQIPWSGSGKFLMRYVNVADQTGTVAIADYNGTTTGSHVNTSYWTFPTGAEPQLIQTSTNSGGSGTTQVTLPALGFKPRAGDLIVVAVSAQNQNILTPADNAGNTYQLVASTTFGSSPSYALSLYYAKNIVTTSSLVITASGTGGASPFLSASAFEYTGMAPSSTFAASSTNTDTSGSATNLSSFSVTGQASNELYFGIATLAASTTAISNAPWNAEAGVSNNSTLQSLYVEDFATTTNPLTIPATWTAVTSTSYSAITAIFRAPFEQGYQSVGTLDSATFDTGVTNGANLNSITWQGSVPSGGNWGASFPVGLQVAVSNSASGPWSYEGPSGDGTTYFHGNTGTQIDLDSTSGGLTLFNGYRYFRYRVTLFADPTYTYTPTVSQVTVNWSP